MRVAVVGSREFTDYDKVKDYLDRLNAMRRITMVISGGAKGADSLAEKWARDNKVNLLVYEALWDDLSNPDARIKTNAYGKQYDANAGHRRNRDIVDSADIILAFWNGTSPGTRNTINYANSIKKSIKVIRI